MPQEPVNKVNGRPYEYVSMSTDKYHYHGRTLIKGSSLSCEACKKIQQQASQQSVVESQDKTSSTSSSTSAEVPRNE